MLASAELGQDFAALNQQSRRLVASLQEDLDLQGSRLEVGSTSNAMFRGFEGDRFYYVESGSLSVCYNGRVVYLLEQGDLLLPDALGIGAYNSPIAYASSAGATLVVYSALEFMRRVFADPGTTKQWTRLLVTHNSLLLRLAAALGRSETQTTPGFETYEAGQAIILQGERPDFVYNLMEGSAEVVVDEVVVGRVAAGEIFGAMAALTQTERSASVVAKTRCAVVKVPKEQFVELIKNNPKTIHTLLVDMANSIVSLNEQLVSLRGN